MYLSGDGRNQVNIFGSKFVLPLGTVRQDYKNYEEIIVPFAKACPPQSNESRVLITDLDELTKRAFKGYTTLNRVQSIVYPIGKTLLS